MFCRFVFSIGFIVVLTEHVCFLIVSLFVEWKTFWFSNWLNNGCLMLQVFSGIVHNDIAHRFEV